jgi:hypothetical protein
LIFVLFFGWMIDIREYAQGQVKVKIAAVRSPVAPSGWQVEHDIWWDPRLGSLMHNMATRQPPSSNAKMPVAQQHSPSATIVATESHQAPSTGGLHLAFFCMAQAVLHEVALASPHL